MPSAHRPSWAAQGFHADLGARRGAGRAIAREMRAAPHEAVAALPK
jgi:hypothetical protein